MREKPSILMSALYGGIVLAGVSAIPGLNILSTPCCCCAGILFGGFMAVFFYKKELTADMPLLASSDCLQLGALAGVLGGIIAIVLHYGVVAMFGNVGGEFILKVLENFKDKIPSEAWDQIEEGINKGLSPFQAFVSLIIDTIFGLLGGLIGYAVLKPKQQMMNVQPPSQPPTQMQ